MAIIVKSQIACAMIKIEAMKAENTQREAVGASMAYTHEAFIGLIDEYGLGWNDVIGMLNEGDK